jgi:hypothetical protein
VLDRYLSAVLTHTPSAAPLASDFRYTENAEQVRPGDGLWKSLTALGKVQRRYLDTVSEQAVYFGQIEEGAVTNLATMRIRVSAGRITEGEVVIARQTDVIFDAVSLAANVPPEKAPVETKPATREAYLAAARSYFDGVQNHLGSSVLAFKGCTRIENGVLTAAALPTRGTAPAPASSLPGIVIRGDCTALEGFKTTIAAVSHRRFPVVDEQAGVVLGLAVFDRPPGAVRDDGKPYPRNLLTEIFAIENGKIRSIWAIMHYMQPDVPYAPGW